MSGWLFAGWRVLRAATAATLFLAGLLLLPEYPLPVISVALAVLLASRGRPLWRALARRRASKAWRRHVSDVDDYLEQQRAEWAATWGPVG